MRLKTIIKSPVFWVGLMILFVSLIPYGGVGRYDFINLDDYSYVSKSPVAGGFSGKGLVWAVTSFGYQATWMPLTWLSYMTDVSLWGLRPGPMHLHNVFLHAANAVLLFALLLMLLRRRRQVPGPQSIDLSSLCAAALAALFWSLHPLRVEPVAWVASRKDLLSLFWELIALLAWVQSGENGETQRTGKCQSHACWSLFSQVCFVLACMAKPTAMTFPLLAALLDYVVRRKVRWAELYVPALMAMVCAAVTTYAQAVGGATSDLAAVPFVGRVANAMAALGLYCWKTVWPTGLAMPYLHAWPSRPIFYYQGVLICAVLGAILCWSAWPWLGRLLRYRAAKTRSVLLDQIERVAQQASEAKVVLFSGTGWFLIAVAPMLGLAHFGYHSHADRFTYLPAIGFSFLLSSALAALFRHCGRIACWALTFAILVVWTALGVLSWRQTQVWHDTGTLASHTLTVTGQGNDVAQKMLGTHIFSMTGNAAAALPPFDQVFRTNRRKSRCYQSAYVFLLAKAGRMEEAQNEARDFSAWAEEERNRGIEKAGFERRGSSGEDAQTSVTDQNETNVRLCYAAVAYYSGDREAASERVASVLKKEETNPVALYLAGLLALDDGRTQEAVLRWRSIGDRQIFFNFLQERLVRMEAL